MLRLIDVISASLFATAACNPHGTQNTGGAAGPADNGSQTMTKPTPPSSLPKSTLEQVQRSVPASVHVGGAGLVVTGVELFVLTGAGPVPADGYSSGTLIGVVGGLGGKIVEDRELVRAVIDANPDPRTLARVALWVAHQEGQILEAPQNDVQRKAKVAPPVVAGGALVFWVWTTGVSRMLEQGKLDLSTGAFELAAPPVSRDDAIASAITALAGTSVSMQTAAIRTLGEACADPNAKQALLDALANHPRDETRSAAADAAPRCGAGAVDALIHTLEHDKAPLVRGQAANALGAIGEARARPALEKAARSDDANLAWAANHALKQLK